MKLLERVVCSHYDIFHLVPRSFNKQKSCFSDPPDDNPYTEQAIQGPIDTGKSVTLKCTAVGGNPLASLSWDCAGITSNISTNTKSILSVEFTVDKNYNSKLCTCHATHPIKSYSPISKHELIVYCEFTLLPYVQK